MAISSFFKKFCIVFLLPLLFACGGDVDDYGNGDSTAPNISLSESSYDFGGIVLDNSSDKTFVITNNGTESLSIGNISVPGDPFTILADTCSSKTLAVNRTCSVSVRFSPIIQAVFTDTVSTPSNDPDGTTTIGLSGEGYGLNVWINKIDTSDCVAEVYVSVTSPIVNLPELTVDNFQLKENGEFIDQSRISSLFPFYTTSPVSVVLAIDWSGSVIGVIETIKAAGNAFVDNLNPITDEAAACKFNNDIEFNPAGPDPLFYTANYAALKSYITDDFTGSDGTRLYDAVYDCITRAAEGVNDKKVVIVLSDGVNHVPVDAVHTLAEVIAYATTEAIPVFTIYYRDPDYEDGGVGNPEVMEQLAEETGGKYYDGTVDLMDVYQQISSILTGEYGITHTSLNCPGDVALEVLVDYTDPDEGPLYGQDSGTITFP